MADIEATREMSRAEVARYLREFADKLEGREQSGQTVAGDAGRHTADERAVEMDPTSTEGDRAVGDERTTDTERTTVEEQPTTDTERMTVDEQSATVDEQPTTDRHATSGERPPTGEGVSTGTAGETDVEGREGTSGRGEKITFVVGNDSATINPPETVTFDVDVGSDSSLMESGSEERVVFSLSWNAEDVDEDDELSIT